MYKSYKHTKLFCFQIFGHSLLSEIEFIATRCFLQTVFVRSSRYTLSFTNYSDRKMAIWCFNKTIACGTIASVALVYYIIVLHNRKEKKETDSKLEYIYSIKICFHIFLFEVFVE